MKQASETARMILIVLCLLTTLLYADSLDQGSLGTLLLMSELDGYGVFGRGMSEVATPTWYIVRWQGRPCYSQYSLLDSVEALDIVPGDTNSLVCAVVGSDSTYLVRIRMGVTVRKDTLLAIAAQDPSNWLNELRSYSFCMSKSLVAGVFPANGGQVSSATSRHVEIRKITKAGGLELVKSVPGADRVRSSRDFSQFFCSRWRDSTSDELGGACLIYDVLSDQSSLFSDPAGGAVLLASCRSRGKEVLYLRAKLDTVNVWASDGDHATQLTFEVPPRCVRQFYMESGGTEISAENCQTLLRDSVNHKAYWVYH